MNRFCHACGAAMRAQAAFCPQCGVSANRPSLTASQADAQHGRPAKGLLTGKRIMAALGIAALLGAYPAYLKIIELRGADLNWDGVVSESEVLSLVEENRAFLMEPGTWSFQLDEFAGYPDYQHLGDAVIGSKELDAADIRSLFIDLKIDGLNIFPVPARDCVFEKVEISKPHRNYSAWLTADLRCNVTDPTDTTTGIPAHVSIGFSRSCMKGWWQWHEIATERKNGQIEVGDRGYKLAFRANRDDSCASDSFFGQTFPNPATQAAPDAAATATADNVLMHSEEDMAPQAAASGTFHVIADANVRHKATAASAVVGRVSRGNVLTGLMIIGLDGESNWLSLADGSGFISSVNIAQTPPPELVTILGDRRFSPPHDLELRAGPADNWPVIDVVPAGTALVITGITGSGFAEAKGRSGGVGYFRAEGFDLSRPQR